MRQRLVPALLRQRDYRLLWTAHTGSVVGDGLHSVAITWLTYSTLGAGAPGLAALGIALVIPNLALGILSGTLVDRWDRRRVMVYADLARAAITGLLALSVFAGVVSLPVVIAAGIGMILASQFFGPAQGAVLPAYVASDQIVQANAMLSTSRQAASLLTPGIGALLFAAIGPTGLFLIDGASFLWSAFLVARRDRHRRRVRAGRHLGSVRLHLDARACHAGVLRAWRRERCAQRGEQRAAAAHRAVGAARAHLRDVLHDDESHDADLAGRDWYARHSREPGRDH